MNNQSKAYVYALITVGLWSTVGSASKITLRYLQPAEILLIAATVSTCVLFCLLLYQKKMSVLLSMSRKDWLVSCGYGVLTPFAYYLILFKAYDLLPAQQAQIINYTWAITLSLLSIPILGQKVVGKQWLAIGLSYTGVMVIATNGDLLGLHFSNPFGVVLALISTVIWAFYWILNTRDRRDPLVGLFMNFACGLPFIIGYTALTQGFRTYAIEGVLGAVYLGVFEMGISFFLWLKAMKYTNNTAKIANLIFIAPFTSLVFIYFLVGEEIYPSTWVGLILVMSGLVLQSFYKDRTIR